MASAELEEMVCGTCGEQIIKMFKKEHKCVIQIRKEKKVH